MTNKKGITLVALVTMMLLIIMLASTITYVSVNAINVKKANNVKADLRTLTDKVEEYFLKHGSLPTIGAGMAINPLESPDSDYKIHKDELPESKLNKFDEGEYFFINYNLFDGLILNDEDRAYVVNEVTHTVYAVGGYNTSDGKDYALPYVNRINLIEE